MDPGLVRLIEVAAWTCPVVAMIKVVVGSDGSPKLAIDTAPVTD